MVRNAVTPRIPTVVAQLVGVATASEPRALPPVRRLPPREQSPRLD